MLRAKATANCTGVITMSDKGKRAFDLAEDIINLCRGEDHNIVIAALEFALARYLTILKTDRKDILKQTQESISKHYDGLKDIIS
jgi:hypothetical protein